MSNENKEIPYNRIALTHDRVSPFSSSVKGAKPLCELHTALTNAHTRTNVRLTSQLARYPPWRMTTCVSWRGCVNPRRCRISHPISENIGAISARANSHTVDLHTYRRFDGATWLELRRNGVPYTCNPERSVLGDGGALSSECPIWKFMGYPICALNTPLYMRRAFTLLHRLIRDGDICVPSYPLNGAFRG